MARISLGPLICRQEAHRSCLKEDGQLLSCSTHATLFRRPDIWVRTVSHQKHPASARIGLFGRSPGSPATASAITGRGELSGGSGTPTLLPRFPYLHRFQLLLGGSPSGSGSTNYPLLCVWWAREIDLNLALICPFFVIPTRFPLNSSCGLVNAPILPWQDCGPGHWEH